MEFVPVPGGYGSERVRLRIEPGEKRPVQGVVGAEEKIPPLRAAMPKHGIPRIA